MKNLFVTAKPIWVKGKEQEVNCRAQFKAVCKATDNAKIHIATSGIYQLWINGKFISYGPARAGKKHFRMEEIDISKYLTNEENSVVIEVAGYYCSNFYVMQQDSFLQAEIVVGEKVLAATGSDFSARINPCYIQKIQRYSYQRTFAESYKSATIDAFFTDLTKGDEQIEICKEKTIIERKVGYPEFEKTTAKAVFSGGVEKIIPKEYTYDRYCISVGMKEGEATGWKLNEVDSLPEKDYQEMKFLPFSEVSKSGELNDSYNIYEFPYNATGMISLDVTVESDTVLYLAFDEIINENMINPTRCRGCNIIKYQLQKGTHRIHTFEVYTMKYLQIIALGGNCSVDNIKLVEYKHPPISVPTSKDKDLQKIIDAAVETYRQNSVDLFMDCPSRERAGWLCDSFFTARAEYALTGKNIVEENFLENFLHEDIYGKVPKGMVPMCYPADHRFGRHIPSWGMFLVVELRDYLERTGNREFVDRFKDKVYGLIEHFKEFENSDGLLEDLKSWVFVEWSRANDTDMVQGINYPNNMMFYLTLKCASELYDDKSLLQKAENMKAKILEQSFGGEFFVDRAVRTNDGVYPIPESTEVCQYYAFFTGVATAESHPELLNTLIKEFGPQRDTQNCYPDIWPAAPFIGNYMRLQILMDNGYENEVLENIKGYFMHMANITGTLWEKAESTNSCNHGFASAVLYWLKDMDI